MAHNVLNMRRSSPPYKANRRFAVGWNVGERKPYKAACGDCGFSNPEPPLVGGVTHIVCYAKCHCFYTITFFNIPASKSSIL